MATKEVFNSVYRTSSLSEDGLQVERKVYEPGDDVTGLDSDVKKDLKERGLIVDRETFESDETDSGSRVETTNQVGTVKQQAKDKPDADEGGKS